MRSMDISLLATIGAVFLAAGVVKGVSGMGLPTLSMALLGLVLPPATAAALMVLPSLATNLAQCLGPHWRLLAWRLWLLWLGLVLATLWSPLPDLATAGPAARVALGAVLVAYGLWGLARPALPDLRRHAAWLGTVAGLLSGVLTAATGVFVMPLVPYLQALRLDREELMQALGLSLAIATVALALRLGPPGMSGESVSAAGHAVGLAAAFLGLWIGTTLRRRLSPRVFQRALHGGVREAGGLDGGADAVDPSGLIAIHPPQDWTGLPRVLCQVRIEATLRLHRDGATEMTDTKGANRQIPSRKMKPKTASSRKAAGGARGKARRISGAESKTDVIATPRNSSPARQHAHVVYVRSKGIDDFVVEVHAADPIRIITTERMGVAGVFVKDLAKRMEIPAQRMCAILGVPKATAEKKVSSGELLTGNGGRAALGMTRLLGIAQEIVEGSTAPEARDCDSTKWLGQWLEKPQPALGGHKPAELIDTPTGVDLVAKLLGAIESGAYQ
jgi:uncharacterized protein